MLDSTFNQKKAEAFSLSLVDTLNKSAIALALSIGSRCGLFEVLAGLPDSTSEQIAEAANLNERYVREWLGTMVTGPRYQLFSRNPAHTSFRTNTRRF